MNPTDPVIDECFGGTEGTQEVHTFWGGFRARLRGIGPFEIPPDVPPAERYAMRREHAYYTAGWEFCNFLIAVKDWVRDHVDWKRWRGIYR